MGSLLDMDTFFGKLVSSECDHSSCSNCILLESENYYLKQKVKILESIVDTSQVIAEINQTLSSNHNQSSDQTVIVHGIDVGVQTDCHSSSSLVDDGIFNVPDSFALIDCNGKVEGPSSIFSLGSENRFDNLDDFCPIISVGDSCSNSLSLTSVSSTAIDNPANTLQLAGPCTIIDDCPFQKFSLDTLLSELTFTHIFQNREAVYFGEHPYSYKGGIHHAKDVPQGSYLKILCSYMEVLLPDYQFNSVLVNFYKDGNCFIPPHSDSEECIEEDSVIMTVSLGATRSVKFYNHLTGEVASTIELRHGELTAMTKLSQKLYKHEILPDPLCNEMRVSLTFRLIRPEVRVTQSDTNFMESENHVSGGMEPSGYVPFQTNSPTPADKSLPVPSGNTVPTAPPPPDNALYISSSMFRFIDTKKLSSECITADKLFYPGADASSMLSRLKRDLETTFTATPSSIFIMCGTNNVDSIYFGRSSLHNAFQGLQELLEYLKMKFKNIPITILNILPRSTLGRNDIVNELNKYLEAFCHKNLHFNYLDTKSLFSFRDGTRINRYFVPPNNKVRDNCHLNSTGVARLGKFIKYWSHNLSQLN